MQLYAKKRHVTYEKILGLRTYGTLVWAIKRTKLDTWKQSV